MRDTEDEVVGFVALEAEKVEMLFVHPDYRVLGVSKRLTRYALDERGTKPIEAHEQNV